MLEDLQLYMRSRGKRFPPGELEDVLVKIGVPRAKRIISQQVYIEEQGNIQPEETTTPPIKKSNSVPAEVHAAVKPVQTEETGIEIEEQAKPLKMKTGEVTVISEKDMPAIEDALSTVDALSDSFMASTREEKSVVPRPQIRVSIEGTQEVVASDHSTATDPLQVTSPSKTVPAEPVAEAEPESTLPEPAAEPEPTPSAETATPAEVEDTTEEQIPLITGSKTFEEATSPKTRKTSEYAVKPLVTAKVVILGEDGVGKHSLMEKADLRPQEGEEGPQGQYIKSGVFQLTDYRVNLNVWNFDEAANARVSRKDFYADIDIVIVVYSVSDRWSFESIDFWLRDAMVKHEEIPPVVIVGNKKDIRDAGNPDPLEPPVTSEEGFRMAENLAKRLGVEDRLHPVAFIETSCLTGEGTTDVFRTASEFYTALL